MRYVSGVKHGKFSNKGQTKHETKVSKHWLVFKEMKVPTLLSVILGLCKQLFYLTWVVRAANVAALSTDSLIKVCRNGIYPRISSELIWDFWASPRMYFLQYFSCFVNIITLTEPLHRLCNIVFLPSRQTRFKKLFSTFFSEKVYRIGVLSFRNYDICISKCTEFVLL